MMTSIILRTGTRFLFHTILVVGVYLLFAGHNQPGGGFIGGLVAATAFVLHFLAEGPDGLQRTIRRVRPSTLLGCGVLLAVGTGAAAWFVGGEFLESGYATFDLPVLGELAVTSVLAFDLGVFLVVVGLVVAILESLGGELQR